MKHLQWRALEKLPANGSALIQETATIENEEPGLSEDQSRVKGVKGVQGVQGVQELAGTHITHCWV